jgi:hypothetical protein
MTDFYGVFVGSSSLFLFFYRRTLPSEFLVEITNHFFSIVSLNCLSVAYFLLLDPRLEQLLFQILELWVDEGDILFLLVKVNDGVVGNGVVGRGSCVYPFCSFACEWGPHALSALQ